jgi:prophage regulatory protein
MTTRYQPFQKIIRIADVLNIFGISKSTLFNRINSGLLPPSIPLGGRAVGWLESEIETALKAYITNTKQSEIILLVKDAVASRKSLTRRR